MGPQEATRKTYLSVSFGRLRKNSDDKDSKAVMRELKDKTKVYECVYQNIVGVIESVTMRTHEKYGNSWIINLEADGEVYAVQVQENSRYGVEFLKKLPNLHKGSVYKFTPYDFTRNGKHKIGLAVQDEAENKIQSFFQKFSGSDEEGWVVENLNGYPEYTGKKDDKEELKIYYMQVTRFLRNYALKHLQVAFLEPAPPVEVSREDESEVPAPGEDDLPF